MSMSKFRADRELEGHTVEVADETHEDVNAKPVRAVVYRSKFFVPKEIEEIDGMEEITLKEKIK